MSNQAWTFGGGPAERIENHDGNFTAGTRLRVYSTITGNRADINLETGSNGRIPEFHLPGTWEWSTLTITTDADTIYQLGQARELQQRPATVLRLKDTINTQQRTIYQQRTALAVQGEQIGVLLTQVAATSSGSGEGLPVPVSPGAPELPAPSDPNDGGELPFPGDLPLPGEMPDPTVPGDDSSSLPLPEGFPS